jgi:hypothetical protein
VVRKFGEELQLQLLQLADFGFGLDSLLVMVWNFFLVSFGYYFLVCYPWREVCHLVWLLSLVFAFEIILFQG